MHAKGQSNREGARREQRAWRERSTLALAERQHDVMSKRQLEAHGLGRGAIAHRVKLGHLHPIHRGVYAVGRRRLSRYGTWMAAVLAYGDGALLSHRSAAALWGLIGFRAGPAEVTQRHGKLSRAGLTLHRREVPEDERAVKARIPVTSVSRTLVDLAAGFDSAQLRRAFEEADRLGLVEMEALKRSCERARGRRGIARLRQLIREAPAPSYPLTPLEGRFLEFHRTHLVDLPAPQVNVSVLDREVDAYWPQHRLVVEMDSWEFHRHRAAFESDRARDIAFRVAGYQVVRLTDRRLKEEPDAVALELRRLLTA